MDYRQKILSPIIILIFLLIPFQANSELIDRGGGLIYDTDLNITWLQDGNYAQTSGYIVDGGTDGYMDWDHAIEWAEELIYQGYTDWRLPEALNNDGVPCSGSDCYESEAAHLFLDEGISESTPSPFLNVQAYYWSGTEISSDPLMAKSYTPSPGFGNTIKSSNLFAWAVRDGDSIPFLAPEAFAGDDQEAIEGDTVTLDASGSTDPDDSIVSYSWQQTAGPPVILSDNTAIKPTFITPIVAVEGVNMEFEVMITDESGRIATDRIAVYVVDNEITDFPDDTLPAESGTGKLVGFKMESSGAVTRCIMTLDSDIPETENQPSDMIYGLFDLEIKADAAGETVKIRIYLEEPAPEGYLWYKYSYTDGWYDFSDYVEFDDTRESIVLTLTDGGAGDDDGEVNGIILDPSGLGLPSSDSAPISSSGSGGGCFIATASYGSPIASQVNHLNASEIISFIIFQRRAR